MGYDDFFESSRKKLGLENFDVARVAVEYKGSYKVINPKGEFLAKITGKQIFNASSREDYPAVGDWVAMTDLDGEHATISSILPRKTILKRKSGDYTRISDKAEVQIIATNINVAFIVESVGRNFNLNRFERFFSIANSGGVKAVAVLNKVDLISKEELDLNLAEIKNRFNETEIITTSTVNESGSIELNDYIKKGKTYCFLGSSGVGKSSLINRLLGEDIIKTENIGSRTGKGKHATTTREMYFLDNGGIVIDNPGIRGVGMAGTIDGVGDTFDEITTLAQQCKFVDCTHTNEPGCAVLEALDSGVLNAEKYANYINLKKEAEYYEMSEQEKKEKDRQFGKFMKTAKKDLKKYKY